MVELVDEAEMAVAPFALLARAEGREVRCSSVLFPEPDAPTMASASPRRTSRSTPRSTVTSSASSPLPSRNCLTRPRATRIGPSPFAPP